jgi:hypothetical protein
MSGREHGAPTQQPVPDVSWSDVDRVLARDFDAAARERIAVLLDERGAASSPRVVLAVLKLSAGRVDAVGANLEAALTDWRDVIAYAEYPAYMRATSGAADVDAARREELVCADRAQYEAWLGR